MAKLIHSMVRVLGLQRSLDFYAKALELHAVEHFDFDRFALVYLRNDESAFEIELTLNKGHTRPNRQGDAYGHLAACVNDCRAERERLLDMGLQPGEIMEFQHKGDLVARFFFVQDPDGHKIKVLERHGRYR